MMDANAAPPAPSQPFGGLLETVREERQQDRKIKLIESLSRTAIFRLEMQMSMPAEQRTDMAAHNNLSLEEFDRRLEQTLALARARAGSMNYGDLRDESLAYMQSQAAEILPSRAWEEEDRAYIAETEREMVAAAAAAVEACAADTAGQTCFICMDGDDEEGLVRMCACRGGNGFVHVSCLAKQANMQFGQHLAAAQRSHDTRNVFLRWLDCRLCEQPFHGLVALAMARACVSTYASRSPGDGVRASAMSALMTHLPAGEAVTYREQLVIDLQQHGADEASLIEVKSNLGRAYGDAGRYDEALAIWREVYERGEALRGPEHEETLVSAGNLASSLLATGHHDEAKTLLRDKVLPTARRVLPPENDVIVSCDSMLALAIYKADDASVEDLREAVALLETVCTTSRRVYGAEHPHVAIHKDRLEAAQAKLAAAVTAAAAAGP